MRYRLSLLLSTQSAQPLLRSNNLGSSQLFLVSRKDTRLYAWIWRETLPCLL